MLDLDADQKPTKDVDRYYMLNPWPEFGGLRYSISRGGNVRTTMKSDSRGRGDIRYLEVAPGRRVRVDTYLIPLSELARKVGDKIRLCYYGKSPKPVLTVNSAGYQSGGKDYFAHSIPFSKYHDYVLVQGADIDPTEVPEGRKVFELSHSGNGKMPDVGQTAPEIAANGWINLEKAPTLAQLRGKVVALEFWATWCEPCITGIPRLNQLQSKYGPRNFQLLSFVHEGHTTMDKFLKDHKVEYPIGLESASLETYGITLIPQAFVLDKAEKIVWHGNPDGEEMGKAIAAAMGARQ
jgi:thiol-disulfide isomerase/thioredoxin